MITITQTKPQSTALAVLAKQVIKANAKQKGLKTSKAKAHKPSKVMIVVTKPIHAIAVRVVKAIGANQKKSESTYKSAAADYDKALTPFKTKSAKPTSIELATFRAHYEADRKDFCLTFIRAREGRTDSNANKEWSRISEYMDIKKPVSQNPKAKAMAKLTKARIKSGAKIPKAKTGADGRITPFSVKLLEIKDKAEERGIYSVKALNTLQFAIDEFESCEKENKSLSKPKAK